MEPVSADKIATPFPGKYGLLSTLRFADNDTTSSKFCELCANFEISAIAEEPEEGMLLMLVISQHEIRQQYEDVYPEFPRLKRRASSGCTFCSFVRNSLLVECCKQDKRPTHKREAVQIILTASMYEQVEDKSALSFYRNRGPHSLKIQVRTRENNWSPTFVAYNVTFQTSSEPTVTLRNPLVNTTITNVKQWLKDCDTQHSSRQAALTKYTPTRLLAIQDDVLRLVTGRVDDPRYMALSYCWGQARHERSLTTESNIDARFHGFPIDDLSRTLQDAILTTRALGINYIWIDAICTVQGNPDDWAREASKMGEIYNHAYLTLAPVISESARDGFLQDRQPCFKASLEFNFHELQSIRAHPETSKTGTIHFRYPPETGIENHLSTCKWNQRGWTLQEKLLSTRILYFTKDVLYFKCMTSQQVENHGYILPERQRFHALLAESRSMKLVERDQKRKNYFSDWYKITEVYTMRAITNPGDKLPAVQGLAELCKDVLDDDCIYGLWKSDLHLGLLWHSLYGLSCKLSRHEDGMPTWSWASRDGCVFWDKSTFTCGWKSLINVLNVSSHRKCSHCEQTKSVQLEVMAPVAPLKDVLLAIVELDGDDWHPEDLREVTTWREYEDFGCLETDDDRDTPMSLDGTEMMLVVEKEETKNIQAIILQSSGNSNFFKRIGWFILKPTRGEMLESYYDDRDFKAIRKVFKPGKRILV